MAEDEVEEEEEEEWQWYDAGCSHQLPVWEDEAYEHSASYFYAST